MNDPRRVRFGKRWVVIAALIVLVALLALAALRAVDTHTSLSQSINNTIPIINGTVDVPETFTPFPYTTATLSS